MAQNTNPPVLPYRLVMTSPRRWCFARFLDPNTVLNGHKIMLTENGTNWLLPRL